MIDIAALAADIAALSHKAHRHLTAFMTTSKAHLTDDDPEVLLCPRQLLHEFMALGLLRVETRRFEAPALPCALLFHSYVPTQHGRQAWQRWRQDTRPVEDIED